MGEKQYQLERKIEKFDERIYYAILSVNGYSGKIRADMEREINGLLRSFEPKVVLEWCTPQRMTSGERKRPCCTYDGCGGSDDEPGSTWTEKFIEAQYWPEIPNFSLRVPSIKEGIMMRREVLHRYFEQARTNPNMWRAAIQYRSQIRNFLATHKR